MCWQMELQMIFKCGIYRKLIAHTQTQIQFDLIEIRSYSECFLSIVNYILYTANI